MFNYQKEIIINDIAKVVGATDSLLIKRGANYAKANIADSKIYKTSPRAGQCASVAITVPSSLTTGYQFLRLSMFLSTPSKEFVEFAYPNYQEFGKPFIVETSALTGSGVANAIKLAINEDNELFTVSATDQVVTITTKESWIDIKEVSLVQVKPINNTGLDYEETASAGTVGAINHAVVEFATAKWLVENLRFPSYPNLRYNHLYADESPVAGKKYYEYMFNYKIENATNGGTLALGMVNTSLTQHILYVNEDIVTDFETELAKLSGITIVEALAMTGTTTVAAGSTTAMTLKYEGADMTETDATWASSDTSKATVSTAGVVTGVAAGSAVITASYKGAVASQTVTVTA